MFRRVIHPGQVLKDELIEMGVTPTAFARQIEVPPNLPRSAFTSWQKTRVESSRSVRCGS